MSEMRVRNQFLIVQCYRCGKLSMAKEGQKTKMCPYCGSKLAIGRTRVLACAKDPKTVLLMLRKLKRQSEV